ncbi:response regulator [Thiohalophilus thiocyanatoxydans]|uniref:LuxR family two component transcriptional regulator n=1 Tax=Thiohalophilus thiocyanatoxydans TaxID=381308 RepID=A0A4R8IQ85_9GAMM|nr:response regulator [Thiohalophilus thiocyanatoxydans]TDY02728.1 LuxR family two component transcriptional regulator [Thiohalophilus thiocyanatoxydans]
MSLRVLLIDDHTLFRVGLEGLLASRGIEIVASVGSGQDCLRLVEELKPDVVLLDMRMPGIDGLSVLKVLRENDENLPIVMLTTSSDEGDLLESLREGAQGYLLKDMEPDDLVLALRDIVNNGKTVVAPDLAPILAKAVQGSHSDEEGASTSPFDELTPRETEILGLLAEGQSNKAIARNLGISDGTVKLHVKAILRKLDVHSRVEAAVMAVEYGLSRATPE